MIFSAFYAQITIKSSLNSSVVLKKDVTLRSEKENTEL